MYLDSYLLAVVFQDKSGSNCTLVHGLYTEPFHDQNQSVVIEVQFFNQQKRWRLFAAELAVFYRAGCQDDLDADYMSSRTTICDGDDIDTRATVTEALHSIFLERREFETKGITRKFFKSASSKDDKEILESLNKWVDKLVYILAGGKESVSLHASTPQELLKEVEVYSTDIMDKDNQRILFL